MDVREKLVAWLCEAMILFDKRKDEKDINPFEVFADHLIANGVTVQEWISVKDRLPEDWCPVLVIVREVGKPLLGSYRENVWFHEEWNTTFVNGAVTDWMPMPHPPKGEKETIFCKDCEHLMFSDCYGECSKGHKGIVRPNDTCKYATRKLPKGE